MTREAVKEIALDVYREKDKVTSALIALVPKVSTKDACAILNKPRKWVYENRLILGGQVKNLRGDFEFDTKKIVNYKNSMI